MCINLDYNLPIYKRQININFFVPLQIYTSVYFVFFERQFIFMKK